MSEKKAGTLTQCLGIATHFDPEPRSVLVGRKLQRWRGWLAYRSRPVRADEPRMIVSCGRKAERHVMAIADRCRTPPILVHLQTPDPRLAGRYDRAFVSRHDWTEDKDARANFSQMLGVPHQITHDSLGALRHSARARFGEGEARRIAVLIGGSNEAYAFDDATVSALLAAIRGLLEKGWTVLATTSRRSDPAILRTLLAERSERLFVWDRTGENPYLDFLAAADAFLVTKDTITMHCEALATGRPVFTLDLAKTEGRKLDKFEWFHRDMSDTLALTRPFEGEVFSYAYPRLEETARLRRELELEFGLAPCSSQGSRSQGGGPQGGWSQGGWPRGLE